MKGTYLQVIKRQWKLIVSVVIVAVVSSLVLSVIQKPMFRTSAELLIVPKNYGANDVYTSAKAAEHLALTFSEVVYTNSFMASALSAGTGLIDDFGVTPLDRKENWAQAIETKVVSNTGFLKIDAYDSDKQQSAFLAHAITNALEQQASQYLGQDDSVVVKVIDSPTTDDQVAKPKIGQNLILGLILGVLAGIGLAFAFPLEPTPNFFDAIRDFRGQYKKSPETVFPTESSTESQPEWPRQNTAETPVDLPVAETVPAPSEKIAVAENEPVELSHEEKEDHWLKTGELR